MRARLTTADVVVEVSCTRRHAELALRAAADGSWTDTNDDDRVDVHLDVESSSEPFDIAGWEPLTRGAWCQDGDVVLRDACGSGYDLAVRATPARLEVRARWRPPVVTRGAATALRGRADLLTRAALLQYPALWWAGVHGHVPVHAPALELDDAVVLLAGPGGVGKSTVILNEVAHGARVTSDNLSVTDGTSVSGFVEPAKVTGGTGPRRAHGRRESHLNGRTNTLVPTEVWVVRRDGRAHAALEPADVRSAARSLTAGTYMAGELRRYWAFAATLAMGTGLGPSHPPIADVAAQLCSAVPCRTLRLGRAVPSSLSELRTAALRTSDAAPAPALTSIPR